MSKIVIDGEGICLYSKYPLVPVIKIMKNILIVTI